MKNCPRCNKELAIQCYPSLGGNEVKYYSCNSCQVRSNDNGSIICYNNFIENGKHLVFEFAHKECTYGSRIEALSGNALTLPLLPLDITPERFKLLLPFI